MISKTIGFGGTLFSDTPKCTLCTREKVCKFSARIRNGWTRLNMQIWLNSVNSESDSCTVNFGASCSPVILCWWKILQKWWQNPFLSSVTHNFLYSNSRFFGVHQCSDTSIWLVNFPHDWIPKGTFREKKSAAWAQNDGAIRLDPCIFFRWPSDAEMPDVFTMAVDDSAW